VIEATVSIAGDSTIDVAVGLSSSECLTVPE
jgi:hypothetical protein